jgi:hypothetical protein
MFVETRRGLFNRGCATAYIRLKGAYLGLGTCPSSPLEIRQRMCLRADRGDGDDLRHDALEARKQPGFLTGRRSRDDHGNSQRAAARPIKHSRHEGAETGAAGFHPPHQESCRFLPQGAANPGKVLSDRYGTIMTSPDARTQFVLGFLAPAHWDSRHPWRGPITRTTMHFSPPPSVRWFVASLRSRHRYAALQDGGEP